MAARPRSPDVTHARASAPARRAEGRAATRVPGWREVAWGVLAVERSGLRPRRPEGVCITQNRRHVCAYIRVTRHTSQKSGRFEVKNVASRTLPSEEGPEVGRCPSPTPGSSRDVPGPGPGLLLSVVCPVPRSRFALSSQDRSWSSHVGKGILRVPRRAGPGGARALEFPRSDFVNLTPDLIEAGRASFN